jgi:hypothetical protein
MVVLIDTTWYNNVPQVKIIRRESHYNVKYTQLALHRLRFPPIAQHPLLGHGPLTVDALPSH